MPRTFQPTIVNRFAGRRWLLVGLVAALAAPGCAKHKTSPPSVTEPPAVQVIQPQARSIVRIVGQPSFVESYERTSIYPKVTGYLEEWFKDIGDKVKKGDVLCTIFVPELREDWETKKRMVKLDKERVDLAEKIVKVAEANVQAAEARLVETQAILAQYEAQVDRWGSEVKRLAREVRTGVVDKQVHEESINQWKSSAAARDAAKATIDKAKAELLSRQATLAQDKVDVEVARAQVSVAESDAKRLEAWVGYLTLTAPYDGVVVARNANTGDFVMPITGDPTADHNAPHLSPSGKAAPIYVIDRTDVVRIFVDIPEHDANYVTAGTKATVLIQAFRGSYLIPATVTRTSWALNFKSRTLRAEIDLHNTDMPGVYQDLGKHQVGKGSYHVRGRKLQIRPNMYAYGKVIIERPQALALPEAALTHSGDQTFYWRYEDGRAVRTEIQTGVSDGEWIEVFSRQVPPKSHQQDPWVPFERSEKVILGDLSLLSDGGLVRLADAERPGTEKVAEATPPVPTAKVE